MTLTSSIKALLISLSISAILLVLLLTSTIKQKQINAEIIKEFDVEVLTELQPDEKLTKKTIIPETNQAFNSNKASNRHTTAYEYIPPAKNFEYTKSRHSDIAIYTSKTDTKRNLKPETLQETSYAKANQVLNHLETKTQENNKNSSVSFSLKNRSKIDIPIPVYLCDATGKIVINITVNSYGSVINTSVNHSASHKNACLQERALQYAKRAVFNISNTNKQIGSITYLFQ